MREIKFRGQHHITKEWLYGWLVRLEGNYYIINKETDKDIFESMNDKGSNQIIPETIGQFTGLKDKDEKEIYEGDIVEIEGQRYYLCWYDDMSFGFTDLRNYPSRSGYECYNYDEGFPLDDDIEIVGNIYQHEHLITEEKKHGK